jgi:hypothetical protein
MAKVGLCLLGFVGAGHGSRVQRLPPEVRLPQDSNPLIALLMANDVATGFNPSRLVASRPSVAERTARVTMQGRPQRNNAGALNSIGAKFNTGKIQQKQNAQTYGQSAEDLHLAADENKMDTTKFKAGEIVVAGMDEIGNDADLVDLETSQLGRHLEAFSDMEMDRLDGEDWGPVDEEDGDITDEFEMGGGKGKPSYKYFKVKNLFDTFAPYRAAFTPDSHRGFSVSPRNGQLNKRKGGKPIVFEIKFATNEKIPRGEPFLGSLIIETEDFKNIYKVQGMNQVELDMRDGVDQSQRGFGQR